MPSVKVTELIEMLDRKIADLKAGDPSWSKEQKKRARDAAEMFKAFKLLTQQGCNDTLQTIPGGGGGGGGSKPPVRKKKGPRPRKR